MINDWLYLVLSFVLAGCGGANVVLCKYRKHDQYRMLFGVSGVAMVVASYVLVGGL